jgi:iron(III) transport system substrate-binding protein
VEIMSRAAGRFFSTIKVSVAALSVALTASVAHAQVADTWDGVVAKAKEEGRVNYYSVMPPAQNDALVAAFQEAYPEISVVVVRGAGELPGRIAAEQQSGADGADVFSYADTGWFVRGADGLLKATGPHAEGLPAESWVVEGAAANLSYSPLGFLVWNTARLPDGLKSWNDLLDPSLKGKIGTREGMTATLAGFLEFINTELGEDYFAAFGKQELRFYPSTVPLTQAVASGEVWAANSGNIATLKQLEEQGAPIAYTFPDPSYANPQAAAALASSKRPNAALLFLDFAMSPEGQAAMNGNGLGASAIPGLEGTLQLQNFRILDPNKYPPDVRDQWQAKFEQFWRQ